MVVVGAQIVIARSNYCISAYFKNLCKLQGGREEYCGGKAGWVESRDANSHNREL